MVYDEKYSLLSGIEDGQVETSGYVCQHLGNLECEVAFHSIVRIPILLLRPRMGTSHNAAGLV